MTTPPRTTERLLAALGAGPELSDALLGDLAEEYALRAAWDGEAAARRWYRREALRVAPHLLRDRARSRRLLDAARVAAIVVATYAIGTALVIGLSYFVPVGFPMSGSAPDAVVAVLVHLRGLALAAVSALTAGYLAAWLDRRSPLVATLGLAIGWGGLALVGALLNDRAPAWFRFGYAATILAFVVLGGMWRAATRRLPPDRAGS